jgi:hypothetical protein
MLPVDAAGWRRGVVALLRRLVALLLALLASLSAASSPAPPPPPPRDAAAEAEPREAEFCRSAAGAGYGYGGGISRLRSAEFARLRGVAYLDHAGAALYSETQVADTARALAAVVMGNPRACPQRRLRLRDAASRCCAACGSCGRRAARSRCVLRFAAWR